jgi:hypothetical protein
MVKYNGSVVDENVKLFKPIPAGKYPVVINDITVATTNKGNEMWKIRFIISEGEYSGRFIFDRIVWSNNEYALARQKQFLKCFKVYHEGEWEYRPQHLIGKKGEIIIELGEYKGKPQNMVPFDGYHTYANKEKENEPSYEGESGKDIPF